MMRQITPAEIDQLRAETKRIHSEFKKLILERKLSKGPPTYIGDE